ncbi:unnamed protein product [Rotaria socialis]|uniref:CCHC-type domain-containing protein n=2 Tax=Rotaria socialis TaxID=392032 RepID=A0A817TCY4_9BILA|nr:unnamed protein product [Rotaria socialis]CAF3313344.1 unnamed protein product [Rotaria socialis]CAF3322902.1 unnamed protein product [Rotaria socialis]CAF4515574.1 unnamed protein product [Rotaria socialis]
MLNQEEIHRYFNHLSGAKRIEFLYGLLHLCQPLELRYLGTCLEEIARKDYEYLYHAEQKTNHLSSTQTVSSSSTSSVSSSNEQDNQPVELSSDEKLDLTDQFTRAHAIVDIALLWAKNRACAIRLFRRLKASESVNLVDLLLERDDLDERTMDEILIIFCLASNHPAFSFDMRTQMSQIFKDLEKRQRKMKLLETTQNNVNDDDTLEQSTCLGYHSVSSMMHNSNTFSVHASPLLTRLTVVNFDIDSVSLRILIRADWSDNNSTLTWKTPNDIRSFHLQLSNIVYHDDVRLERLMNISGCLRDIGSLTEPDIESMKKNIQIYIEHLVYFSSYISTISTLARFFNSSLKLVDSKQRLFNPSNTLNESLSSSPTHSNAVTPLQCEIPIQQQTDADSKTLSSPKLSISFNKSKQQLDVTKQARSIIPTNNGTQTGLEVRCEETQTDRMPGPGFVLAEHQDYLRRYSMDELAKLTPRDLIVDGLDSTTAHLLCGALDDLKPMSVHLTNSNRHVRSPSTFIQIPPSSSSSLLPPPPPPLLDAALMTVVQNQQASRISTHASDRNQLEQTVINFGGVRPCSSSSPSPKLPKMGTINNGNNNGVAPPPPTSLPSHQSSSLPSSSSNCPPQNQHHAPLLTTHSFLYNPMEPCIFPIAIPPGFPSSSSDFIRLFAPNMSAATAATMGNTNNSSGASFVQNSIGSQGHGPNSRSTTQSNGATTPPEQHGPNVHHYHPSSSTSSSTISRHQQSYYRQRQQYPMDSHQFQQNISHSYHHQQRQSQISYSQPQQHNRPKACYTCGDIGHLAFACPEQYSSDSNYSHNTRDGYKLDYRPRLNTSTNLHQQQKQMRSNSTSKTKVRDNS